MNKFNTNPNEKKDPAAKKYKMAKWARHNEKLLTEKMKVEPEKAAKILRLRGEDCHIEGDVVCNQSAAAPTETITATLSDGTPVRCEYRYISSAELKVDRSYQLPVNDRRVRMIIEAFDPRLLDAIKVSFRDGQYFIIDGQHRTAACIALNNGEPVQMYAKIYFDLTQEQEAYLFAKQTGVTRKPGFIPTLNALLMSGDVESLDFANVTEDAGFTLALDGKALGEWRIGCVRKAFEYYRKLGRDAYFEMLLILANWQKGSVDSLRKEIIGGMGMFFKTYAGQFDQKRLLSVLMQREFRDTFRGVTPAIRNLDKRYALQIGMAYNHKLTAKNRLDLWLLQM